MRIREIPAGDRPREKLARLGPGALTDAELLALFLRTGVRGKSAIALAAELIEAKGSLTALSRSEAGELVKSVRGLGPAKASELSAAFELARRVERGGAERPILDSSAAIYSMFGAEFRSLATEALKVLLLDTKLRLIRMEQVAVGTLNECVAHPREIFRPAIVHQAYAVIVIHNHPSGDPAPSEADRRLTRRLAEVAQLIQINLIDHVIMGTADGGRMPYFSFRDSGLL